MKQFVLPIALATLFVLTSCSSEDPAEALLDIVSEKVENLAALQTADYTTNPPTFSGDFIKFSFANGATTTSNTEWDIAFRGTTIIVNGGVTSGIAGEPTRQGNAAAYIENNTLDSVTEVNPDLFTQDSSTTLAIPSGSDNGWYNYNPMTRIVTPIPGKILVFRTHDDHYAKVEILSYYKDSDSTQAGQHYTFNYVYQPNQGVLNFD